MTDMTDAKRVKNVYSTLGIISSRLQTDRSCGPATDKQKKGEDLHPSSD